MKITHHLSRFATLFKKSSLVVRLIIVTSGIGVIAGTATIAAMVAMPKNNETSANRTTSESSGVTVATDNQSSTRKENGQTTDADATTATPQASQTTPQNNTQSTPQDSTGNNSQQDAQTQTPAHPTYTDSYLFKSNCASNSQQTSTQIDPYGYNKCYSSSYTAWKVQERYGSAPLNWGDPKKWPAAANSSNTPVGTTPKLHSVGIQTTSAAGWSVWVEAVHDDNTIDISFYNWNNGLVHGAQYDVSPSAFSTYIYFGE